MSRGFHGATPGGREYTQSSARICSKCGRHQFGSICKYDGAPTIGKFKCEKCGKVIEFSDSHLEKKIAEILRKYNFNITNHSIQIFSICKNCIQ